MQQGFQYKGTFNDDISAWDTSNVTNFSAMFESATAFNQDITQWDTSRALNMSFMLYDTPVFNQHLGAWDTSNVTSFQGMFESATAFNKNISYWVVGSSANLTDMFKLSGMVGNSYGLTTPTPFSTEFNIVLPLIDPNIRKNINEWSADPTAAKFTDPTNVPYYGTITAWDISHVTNLSEAFKDKNFNQNISLWNTSNVTNFDSMFENAIGFNQNINAWDTSNGTSFNSMFKRALLMIISLRGTLPM
jgi:hypothetical protein